MALPNPLPDNPLRWDGWKNYNSANLYDRLCLDFDASASPEQIEDNCRQLLVWWQKKLPLKNQPSNPLAQMLRGGLDEAPVRLAEARTELLNPDARAQLDARLRKEMVGTAIEELKKIIQFAFVDEQLTEDADRRLHETGHGLGLADADIEATIELELTRLGFTRAKPPAVVVPTESSAARFTPGGGGAKDSSAEFRQLLGMSRLALDGGEMTDDQRDAMCNLGESLGLTGGQAEDLIDEYLDQMSGLPPMPASPPPAHVAAPKPAIPKPVTSPIAAAAPVVPKVSAINTSPIARAQEKENYPAFTNSIEGEMLLVTSGILAMGSDAATAAPHEQPVTPVTLSCFHMARFPVTNAQFERFDPSHSAKRPSWAGDLHPVIYVTSRDAEKFCQWLSSKEGRKYRLPTEAEWEYAARGMDGRTFPWGERLDAGHYANFADVNTTFTWRDAKINDGFAELAPVGSFPRGASPFQIEDLAGNVFEWCLDFFERYRGKEIVNPRGPTQGSQRMYRGGSWRSKATSLRASARAFNSPDYSSNDVGFRIICEITE